MFVDCVGVGVGGIGCCLCFILLCLFAVVCVPSFFVCLLLFVIVVSAGVGCICCYLLFIMLTCDTFSFVGLLVVC